MLNHPSTRSHHAYASVGDLESNTNSGDNLGHADYCEHDRRFLFICQVPRKARMYGSSQLYFAYELIRKSLIRLGEIVIELYTISPNLQGCYGTVGTKVVFIIYVIATVFEICKFLSFAFRAWYPTGFLCSNGYPHDCEGAAGLLVPHLRCALAWEYSQFLQQSAVIHHQYCIMYIKMVSFDSCTFLTGADAGPAT